jgi:hypothetical protein
MASEPKHVSKLVVAAVALDEQLRKFELLASSAGRVSLGSKRNLEKAAHSTTEAARAAEELGALVQELLAGLNEARDRNQETVNALTALGARIRSRREELVALERRVVALAAEAAEISTAAQRVGRDAGARDRDALPALGEIHARLDTLVDHAGALHADCKHAGFADLSSEVESLKQQVQSARNKVKLAREQLAPPTGDGDRPLTS